MPQSGHYNISFQLDKQNHKSDPHADKKTVNRSWLQVSLDLGFKATNKRTKDLEQKQMNKTNSKMNSADGLNNKQTLFFLANICSGPEYRKSEGKKRGLKDE